MASAYKHQHMEHTHQHNQDGSTHPLIGAMFTLLFTLLGTITLQNVAWGVAILSGLISMGYTVWKWRNEYNKQNKTNNKQRFK